MTVTIESSRDIASILWAEWGPRNLSDSRSAGVVVCTVEDVTEAEMDAVRRLAGTHRWWLVESDPKEGT